MGETPMPRKTPKPESLRDAGTGEDRPVSLPVVVMPPPERTTDGVALRRTAQRFKRVGGGCRIFSSRKLRACGNGVVCGMKGACRATELVTIHNVLMGAD